MFLPQAYNSTFLNKLKSKTFKTQGKNSISLEKTRGCDKNYILHEKSKKFLPQNTPFPINSGLFHDSLHSDSLGSGTIHEVEITILEEFMCWLLPLEVLCEITRTKIEWVG